MSRLTARTRQISQGLKWACYASMALMAGFALYAVITPGFLAMQAAQQMLHQELNWTAGPLARGLLAGLGALALSAVLYTLWQTARLFGFYGADEVITLRTARAIRQIGVGLMAQAVVGFVGPTLAGLILSIDAPEGQGVLTIQIGSADIGFALAGGLMMLIGLAMVQAENAVRENREFV